MECESREVQSQSNSVSDSDLMHDSHSTSHLSWQDKDSSQTLTHIFSSSLCPQEFSYWFSNPLSNMVEGNRGINNDLISRLHSIMRPFLLRRLKKDVEKQLPGKIEHIVMCKLSRRQQFLYEEFMSRSTTRSLLSGANYMGMMNILMQLRKVHYSRHV